MTSHHYRDVCECGAVISQCRCIEPKTNRIVCATCDKCRPSAAREVADRKGERIERWSMCDGNAICRGATEVAMAMTYGHGRKVVDAYNALAERCERAERDNATMRGWLRDSQTPGSEHFGTHAKDCDICDFLAARDSAGRVVPDPPPRYDDVFREGTAALDREAAGAAPSGGGSGRRCGGKPGEPMCVQRWNDHWTEPPHKAGEDRYEPDECYECEGCPDCAPAPVGGGFIPLRDWDKFREQENRAILDSERITGDDMATRASSPAPSDQCPVCLGRGEYMQMQPHGKPAVREQCERCAGTGKIAPAAGGEAKQYGYAPKTMTVAVDEKFGYMTEGLLQRARDNGKLVTLTIEDANGTLPPTPDDPPHDPSTSSNGSLNAEIEAAWRKRQEHIATLPVLPLNAQEGYALGFRACHAARAGEIERLRIERDTATKPLHVEIERRDAEIARLRARCENTDLDCTDGACPAYWRGSDDGVRGACEQIGKVLDGDTGGVCREPLQGIRERVAALRSRDGREVARGTAFDVRNDGHCGRSVVSVVLDDDCDEDALPGRVRILRDKTEGKR